MDSIFLYRLKDLLKKLKGSTNKDVIKKINHKLLAPTKKRVNKMAHLIGNPYSHKEFSIKRDPSAGIYDPGIGAIMLLTSVHHECLL